MEFPVAALHFDNVFTPAQPKLNGARSTFERYAGEDEKLLAPLRDGSDVAIRRWATPLKERRGVILALHGFTDYSASFEPIAPHLNRLGFDVYAYDQRGFGEMRPWRNGEGHYPLADDASDVAEFLKDRCGVQTPLFLLGESMGGAVAIATAARKENKNIAGLILASPAIWTGNFSRHIFSFIASTVGQYLPGLVVKLRREENEFLHPLTEQRLNNDPYVLREISMDTVRCLTALVDHASNSIFQIDKPVLMLYGTEDRIIDRQPLQRACDSLKERACFCTFDGGPHLIMHWGHSKPIFDAVEKWIEQQISENTKESIQLKYQQKVVTEKTSKSFALNPLNLFG